MPRLLCSKNTNEISNIFKRSLSYKVCRSAYVVFIFHISGIESVHCINMFLLIYTYNCRQAKAKINTANLDYIWVIKSQHITQKKVYFPVHFLRIDRKENYCWLVNSFWFIKVLRCIGNLKKILGAGLGCFYKKA